MATSNNSCAESNGAVLAALHPREQERLRALHTLNVLDSAADSRFDRLTNLAASIFNVEFSLVTLVDENRQWFLSHFGLELTETGRDVSFCSHALHEDVSLVVENMLNDSRFSTNPFVTGAPCIRFYAGIVIRDEEGLPLGTLCLLSSKSREFSSSDHDTLVQLGALVTSELLHDSLRTQRRVRSQLDAKIDPLTRAYAPARFLDSVQQQMDNTNNEPVTMAKIVLPALDRLNHIFGRMVGDELLVELSTRLTLIGKRYDSYILGRPSGRRIALSISGETAQKPNYPLVEAINQALSQPFNTTVGELYLDLHIGIAFGQPDATPEIILGQCRAVLATTATVRGPQIVIYNEHNQQHVNRRLRIAAELQNALDNDDLHLVYQPKVRCSDRKIDGLECLLRWNHSTLGNISPPDILDAAVEVNKLVALDRWVIDQGIKQRASWLKACLKPGVLSINITGQTLLSPGFVSWLTDRLSLYEVTPSDIELEVLESYIFEDFDQAVEVLHEIKILGISLSLDDFGTGYSSLAYLYRLPISVLKIDRAFVSQLEEDNVHKSLCKSILSMAHDLSLSVVAEGVETEKQFAILKDLKCDRVQGYLFSRPVSAKDIVQILETASNGDYLEAA